MQKLEGVLNFLLINIEVKYWVSMIITACQHQH